MAKTYRTVEQRIIDLLREYPKTVFSSKQIHDKVGKKTPRYTYLQLQKLAESGTIYRKPGPNASYLYSITNVSGWYKKNPIPGDNPKEIHRVDVNSTSVRSLLKSWSETKWNPKIYGSAQYLPLGVARLFELVAEYMYGGEVTKSDLTEVKKNLELFKKDLLSTCTTLFSILETPELFDPKKFVEFLVGEDAPPVDLLREQAHKLKEHYK
jgi:hypothetical protein